MNAGLNTHWEPQPAGAAWVTRTLAQCSSENAVLRDFADLLHTTTGTRLADWVDYLHVPTSVGLQAAGFQLAADGWYQHPAALLPPVCVSGRSIVALRVDSVSDFAVACSHRFPIEVLGQAGDLLRQAWITTAESSTVSFGVIEHRGCSIRRPPSQLSDQQKQQIRQTADQLRLRTREFDSHEAAFNSLQQLLTSAIQLVGRDVTCDLFFEGERAFWQGRNRAARVQFMRQAALGMGWGNHDHHTYRSSRVCFAPMIALFEQLGFTCRERFYPGHNAGWGAQVLEHPVCPVVIFADVDLTEAELAGDFAHQQLAPAAALGTIGLWCGLHGEALFAAGMHHLECQFSFDGARQQLAELGINSMKPFTDFAFLRQCFTEPERWTVQESRLQKLLHQHLITAEQAEIFRTSGAPGSHLEILERNDGYRGFNQTGITEIIHRTDPRRIQISN